VTQKLPLLLPLFTHAQRPPPGGFVLTAHTEVFPPNRFIEELLGQPQDWTPTSYTESDPSAGCNRKRDRGGMLRAVENLLVGDNHPGRIA
jgi:hypothetical protein